jgi:hypothetical protein
MERDSSDGLLTNPGSFQKIYTQSEFKQYTQSVLLRKPYMAGLGIAYVFKEEAGESAHHPKRRLAPSRRIDCRDWSLPRVRRPAGHGVRPRFYSVHRLAARIRIIIWVPSHTTYQ